MFRRRYLACAFLAMAGTLVASGGTSGDLNFRVKEIFGERGRGRSELKEPWDVCFTSGGEVAVLDRSRRVVVFFSELGTWLRTVGENVSMLGGTELRNPNAIAADDQGSLWIVDTGNHRIVVLGQDGRLERTVGALGAADGRMRLPSDLSFDRAGNVYVADTGNERIEIFRRDGRFVESWDRRAKQRTDRLARPVSVAYSDYSTGSLWVVNRGSARIEEFTIENAGEWKRSLDLSALVSGPVEPWRIEIEPAFYRMFVADYLGKRLLVVSRRGELLGEVRAEESREAAPTGLAVNRLLDILVAEPLAGRVVWYGKKLAH